MFEKEAKEWVKENMDCCRSENCVGKDIPYFDEEERVCAKSAYMDGAEFGYDRAGEWHFIKDKLPPEPVVVGDRMFPKNYICAYSLNNEYDDYEIGDFLYYGNGEFNGENKDYPIYAWLDKPTVIPSPPSKRLVDVTVHEGQCLNVEGTKELNEKGSVNVKFEYGKEGGKNEGCRNNCTRME